MKTARNGRHISATFWMLIVVNIISIIAAFSSGVVSDLMSYYIWHWDAQRYYALLMLIVPIINILYFWFVFRDESLLGLWIKRRRLEEQKRISELEGK